MNKILKSDNVLSLANIEATDLTITRLTADSPTVAESFEEIKK